MDIGEAFDDTSWAKLKILDRLEDSNSVTILTESVFQELTADGFVLDYMRIDYSHSDRLENASDVGICVKPGGEDYWGIFLWVDKDLKY